MRSGKNGVYFRVWAPNAVSVSVVGSFNGWDKTLNPMQKISSGVYETFIVGVKEYDCRLCRVFHDACSKPFGIVYSKERERIFRLKRVRATGGFCGCGCFACNINRLFEFGC